MIFSHNQQLEWLNQQKSKAKTTLEIQMLNAIETSIYDSKSHIVITNSMVHVTMNHDRYKKYAKLVLNPEQK